jgi:hypothetical protein
MLAVSLEDDVSWGRDGRALSSMTPECRIADAALAKWGKSYRCKAVSGYPSESQTERAARYGKLGIPQQSFNKPEPPMSEEDAATDARVCRLGAIDKKFVERYYHIGGPD